jgi:hypothetical protein
MITLATLKDATAQEVFDQVANHLMMQMEKSRLSAYCVYRSGSLKCAAGCLIGESEYKEVMDYAQDSHGTGWASNIKRGLFPDTIHNELIRELQSIHDNNFPDLWKLQLIELAKNAELSIQNVKGLL